MQADYLILGQGIAGALLSYNLLKEGKTILAIEEGSLASASMVSGGIINPVTGKRLVHSWMAGQLLPFAWDTYREMERELDMPLIRQCDMLEFYATDTVRCTFEDKINAGNENLYNVNDTAKWQQYFRFNYGMGRISPCLVADTAAMVKGWRARLKNRGLLLEEKLGWEDLKIGNGHVSYKGITAKKLVCCEGANGENNPYFKMLPWSKDKGEALMVSIPGLPETHIFKQGISIVPKGNSLFWVGATHDWKYTDLHPTPGFREKVREQLDYWLRLPYKILDHIVALRPANFERKPFAGLHPAHPELVILNGMGGKGASFAPFFADHLAQYLVHGKPMLPDVDVNRFKKILQSR